MAQALDPNTPIVVGIGVAQQCYGDPLLAVEPCQLMAEAVETAAVDAGSESLLSEADIIYVPRGLWEYSDPARLIADEIGAVNARTVLAEIGILQQSLIGDACQKIKDGELDIAIVAGGEAKHRQLRSAITQTQLPDDVIQTDIKPDITMTPEAELWSSIEADAGLGMPVGYYAIMESALRYASGQTVDRHRDDLAQLYERFSQVAAKNPNAWNRQPVKAGFIRDASAKNRMLAFPYTKFHNSQWNVDQAAGIIFCSVKKAQALGIPKDKWVFPLASTESNHMVNTSQRRELHRSPGARLAGNKALESAKVAISEIKYLNMYSCFPAAVQIFAQELGISLDRTLTVTGGMTFGGGPLNNYVLQATCRVIELLREEKERQHSEKALVTSVSGMNTKQGFGLWSTEPPVDNFVSVDVTEQVKAQSEEIELVTAVDGQGVIVGYTVLFSGDQPSRGIAVCDLADGKRTVAYCEEASDITRMMSDELCGSSVRLSADGLFRLADAS